MRRYYNTFLGHFIQFCDEAQNSTKTQIQKIQEKLKIIVKKAEKKGLPIDKTFQHFDKNGDGEISKKEFKKAMNELSKVVGGKLTPSDLNKLFNKFDHSGKYFKRRERASRIWKHCSYHHSDFYYLIPLSMSCMEPHLSNQRPNQCILQ